MNDPNDFYLVTEYLKRPEKGLSSFRSLFELSSDMKYVQKVKTQQLDRTISTEEDARLMNFLTFTVLFYRNDKFNHMRLIEAVDGVYPKRLEELVKSKRDIDRLAKVNGNPFQFYFGMIIDFLEPEDNYSGKGRRNENQKDPGWMRIMSYIMASLFTNKQIDKYFISKILLAKAQFFISKRKMQLWHEIMLKATLVLEYLYRIDALSSTPNFNSEVSKSQSLPNNTPMVNDVRLFLTSHSNILNNSHLRGICAIGMMVGIIIKAQQRYLDSDSAPFVSQLNRLEMDYDRLISMPRRVWPRLKYYDAEEFNHLFTYLVDSEVSNLNPNSFATEKKEIVNLIFTIGMAHGFTIFDKYGYVDKR